MVSSPLFCHAISAEVNAEDIVGQDIRSRIACACSQKHDGKRIPKRQRHTAPRKIALLGLVLIPFSALAQPGTMPAVPLNPPPDAPWFNTSLLVEERAAALVWQMTLEEKDGD